MATQAKEDTGLLRRAAAVLNGDVAGFSRLVADDVDATIGDLERAKAMTRAEVTACAGTLIDFIGDSFMAVFPTAHGAVEAGRRILAGLAEANAAAPARRHLTFRLGIAVGELVSDGPAVFGDAVNVAARVRDTVGAGEIGITGETLVRLDVPELPVDPLGEHRFKNIPEPVHVYRLREGSPAVPDRPRSAFRPRPCLSFRQVLPLLDDDAALARASRVLTQELRAELLRMPAMTVVNGEVEAPEAGDPPPATHILEAWCDRDGDEVRLYFELVDAVRWVPRWTERYSFAGGRLSSHLETIVNDVVSAVDVNVVLGEYGRIYRSRLSRRSVALLHQAHELLIRGGRDSLESALLLLEDMSESEPESPDAPGLVAFACLLQVVMGYSGDPAADLARASDYAARARERGDTTGLPDMVSAQVLASTGRGPEARAAAERSLAVRGTCDATYAVKASVMRYLGEWEEAVLLARQAMSLAPSTPPWYPTVLASAFFVGTSYGAVIDTMEPLMMEGSADAEGMLLLAAAQQGLQMTRNARATLAAFRLRHPRTDIVRAVAVHPFVDGGISARWLGLLGSIED